MIVINYLQYRIGQLYMIARHSFEQSSNGEGVEVVANEEVIDETNGVGQFTEKRIHLSRYLLLKLLVRTIRFCKFIPIYTVNNSTVLCVGTFTLLIHKYVNVLVDRRYKSVVNLCCYKVFI